MRLPLAFRYAARDIFISVAVLVAAGIAAAVFLHPAAAAAPAAVLVFVLAFFRDPERTPPGGEELLVAPADGTITDVVEVDEREFLEAPAVRIGIFLSVFDVHVNRSPAAGRVIWQSHRPGKFVNAMRADASMLNESNWIGLEGKGRGSPRFLVRQVAGLIARRIVWETRAGDRVSRGQRIGMIKFASRTELFIPKAAGATVLVRPGEKVRGGATPVARLGD